MCLTPASRAAWPNAASGAQVAQLEAVLAAGHRMRQVVDRVDTVECGRQRRGVEQIDAHDVGVGEALGQAARVAAGQAQLMPVGCEQRHQAATDIATGTDDEDVHGRPPRLGASAALGSSAIWRSWVMPVRKPASLIER